jgi:hypothetical protein
VVSVPAFDDLQQRAYTNMPKVNGSRSHTR